MTWVLEFDAPKGVRITKDFSSVTVMGNMWYSEDLGKWFDVYENPAYRKYRHSSHHNSWDGSPKTVKAFKRYLRKRPELKGHTVILVNRCHANVDGKYMSLDVVANWVEE